VAVLEESANDELWAGPLLDAMVDVAPEVLGAVSLERAVASSLS
jgi:hypothetical protein